MGFTSETRSNYLRGGLVFSTAYQSDVMTGSNGQPISDVSYSIFPTISLDQTRSRLHWVFTYSPGYTFYQKTSSLNQANQNLGVNLTYRLSPHVTLSLRDSFQQTSSVLNQPNTDLQQASVRRRICSQLLCDSTERRSAHEYRECHAHLPVRTPTRWSEQAEPSGICTTRTSHKFPDSPIRVRKVVQRSIHTAWRKNTTSAPPTNTRCSQRVRPACKAKLTPRAYSVFILSTSIRQFPYHSSAVRNTPARSSSGCLHPRGGRRGRRQLRLAGKTDQLRSQLLANHQRWQWVGRSGTRVQRERLVAPATRAKLECRNWSGLREQQRSGCVAHVQHRRAYNLGKRIGTTAGRPTS